MSVIDAVSRNAVSMLITMLISIAIWVRLKSWQSRLSNQ